MAVEQSRKLPPGMITLWTVGLVGLLAFFLLIYTAKSWQKDFRKNIYLLENLMRSRVALAEGCLWLEECLKGDEAISHEMIMGLYDAAARAAHTAERSGEAHAALTSPAPTDPEIAALIGQFRGAIERFRQIAEERWEGRAADYREKAVDREFSGAFHDAGLAAAAVELQLQRNIDDIIKSQGRVHSVILALWSFMVAGVCFGLFYALRKRGVMEEKLRSSEERFRAVFETSPVAIVISRMDSGVICEVNSGFTRLFGYTGQEVVGRSALDNGFWSDKRQWEAFLSKIKNDGRVDNLELQFHRKDGSLVYGLVSGSLLMLHDEPHLLTITRNIGELKRAQDALSRLNIELEERVKQRTSQLRDEIAERKAAERKTFQNKVILQKVFEGISEPLILFNKNLSVEILNPAAKDYYKINGSRIDRDVPCYESLMGRTEACEGCTIPSFRGHEGGVVFEREGLMDPSRFEEVTLYPIPGQDIEKEGFIKRIKDVTQSKVMQRRIIHREKMIALGVLVSSIAHEINNHNGYISMNVPILKEYLGDLLPVADEFARNHPDFEICNMPYAEFREDVFRLLDNLENGTARVSSFVSNLKEFSKLGQGKASRDWVDLRGVIQRGISICRDRLNKTVGTFRWSVQEDLPPVFSDPAAIEQLVINLLMNASMSVDKEASRVELNLALGSTWQDHVIIEVRDNGRGMDKKTVERVFDPFFTTDTSGEGTGLGLYICHNIVEGLGGRIEVKSRPAEGTTFTIVLPDKDRRRMKRL